MMTQTALQRGKREKIQHPARSPMVRGVHSRSSTYLKTLGAMVWRDEGLPGQTGVQEVRAHGDNDRGRDSRRG